MLYKQLITNKQLLAFFSKCLHMRMHLNTMSQCLSSTQLVITQFRLRNAHETLPVTRCLSFPISVYDSKTFQKRSQNAPKTKEKRSKNETKTMRIRSSAPGLARQPLGLRATRLPLGGYCCPLYFSDDIVATRRDRKAKLCTHKGIPE